MDAQKEQKLIQIFKNVFFDVAESSDENIKKLKKEEHHSWDSASHLLLVTCIEEDFGIKLTDEDVVALDSFKYAYALTLEN